MILLTEKSSTIVVAFPPFSDKQLAMLKAKKRNICYGGARGGGKSYALRGKAVLLCAKWPGIQVMIMRRTYPELEANHVRPLKKLLKNSAKYNKTEKTFTFKNGSTIVLRYAANEDDMQNYQGLEVDVLMIDEATQFAYEMYVKAKAFVRGVNDYPHRIYLTCNPGGRGHAWVRRLFIDRKFLPNENPDEYQFIRSTVYDNKALMESDPDYVKQLESLPDKLRKAWLDGSWDIYEGQFFEEFIDNPEGYDTHINTHVINPFRIPESWPIYRSFDWGYAKPFSCGWWTLDYDGRLYRIAELYGCTDTPNEGVKLSPSEVFRQIAETEAQLFSQWDVVGVADPACWNASTGPSVAEIATEYGLSFTKGDNARISGWQQVHDRLRFDGEGRANLYVFKTCTAFIRTIPLLIYDEHKAEDLDTDGEDHVADETRYMCMMRPIEPEREKKPQVYDDNDPLNQRGDR